jgi:hypothetical protein
MFRGTVSIIRVDEGNLVFSVGVSNMSTSVKIMVFSTEVSNDEFVSLNFFLKGSTGNKSGWWS